MEFGIAFIATLIIGSIIKIGKSQGHKTKPSHPSVADNSISDAEHSRKLQETDELITVILPTINNDK